MTENNKIIENSKGLEYFTLDSKILNKECIIKSNLDFKTLKLVCRDIIDSS